MRLEERKGASPWTPKRVCAVIALAAFAAALAAAGALRDQSLRSSAPGAEAQGTEQVVTAEISNEAQVAAPSEEAGGTNAAETDGPEQGDADTVAVSAAAELDSLFGHGAGEAVAGAWRAATGEDDGKIDLSSLAPTGRDLSFTATDGSGAAWQGTWSFEQGTCAFAAQGER